MSILKKVFDLFLYSNIFVSVCAAAMTVETYLLIQLQLEFVNWLYVAFVFSSTLALYNFPVFTETNFSPDYSERHKWVTENKKLLLFLFSAGTIVSGILVLFFPFKFILWFLPVGAIAFAYFFPQTHLRSITGLKAGIVAVIWTCVTAVYPLFFLSEFDLTRVFNIATGMLVLMNFLFMFPLCVIFNVRDVKADRQAGVRTLAVIYGVRVTIFACVVSLLAFSILVLFSVFVTEIKIALLISGIVSAILILLASEQRSDYYYSFWVDGMILLQAVTVCLLH